MNNFNCIAIETSTQQGSVAASYAGRQELRHLAEGQASSRQIYQLLREMLEDMNVAVADFSCIAFGCGPGSFTGVRVAASAAQALAYAANLPVCRVSSLAALAVPVLDTTKRVVACLDARMGEAYTGIYRRDESGLVHNELADRLVNPQDYRLAEVAPDAVAAGTGWREWGDMLEGFNGEVHVECRPVASEVLQLAARMYADGQTVAPAEALPNYVRNTVTQVGQ